MAKPPVSTLKHYENYNKQYNNIHPKITSQPNFILPKNFSIATSTWKTNNIQDDNTENV